MFFFSIHGNKKRKGTLYIMAVVGNLLEHERSVGCDLLMHKLDGWMFLIFVVISSGLLYFLVSPSCTFNI